MNHQDNSLSMLRKSGLKRTPQRIAIFEILFKSDHHPTAQEVYEQVKKQQPSISMGTVYNVLDSLADLGLVNVLGLIGDDTTHYDGNIDPHLHLNCTACNKILDIDSPTLRKLEVDIQNTTGFEMMGTRFVYYGLCPDCQKSHQILLA